MTTITWEVDETTQMARGLWAIAVKIRAGWKCEECARDGVRLQSHHVNEDDQDNRLANGRCLCGRCHRLAHPQLKYTPHQHTPESRANISRGLKASTRVWKPHTQAARLKMSAAAKKRTPRTGWHHTEEAKAKMREADRGGRN